MCQLKTVLAFIEKEIEINVDTTIIGHSIGTLVAVRLGEGHAYHKMILITLRSKQRICVSAWEEHLFSYPAPATLPKKMEPQRFQSYWRLPNLP